MLLNKPIDKYSQFQVWFILFIILNAILLWASFSDTYFKIAPVEVVSSSVEVQNPTKFAVTALRIKAEEEAREAIYLHDVNQPIDNKFAQNVGVYFNLGGKLEKGFTDFNGVKHQGQKEGFKQAYFQNDSPFEVKQATLKEAKEYRKTQIDLIAQAWIFLILASIWGVVTAFCLSGGEKHKQFLEKEASKHRL